MGRVGRTSMDVIEKMDRYVSNRVDGLNSTSSLICMKNNNASISDSDNDRNLKQ